MEYLIATSRTIKQLDQKPDRQVIPISNKDTRDLIRELKNGKVLVILPDQKYGGSGSIEASFFGYKVPSNPGINKLARLGQAKVLPVFTRRIGIHYELSILPALENFPSGNDIQDTETLHRLYEAEIRDNPSQYLWVHDRWDIKNNNPNLPIDFLETSSNQ
jgi:KDO2-lipid IV(A) lauroyltransferase